MIIRVSVDDSQRISESFRKFIESKNLRKTLQRDEIIAEILRSRGHITADELYANLKKKNPKMGFATVCRNLKLLCNAGILEEIKVGLEKARYEIKTEDNHHDHLICTICGKFIEVFSEKIEKLQDDLAHKNGFKVIRHKLEIYGVCKECQKKEGKER